MGFPRQEYCNTIILFPTPEDLPDSGIKPTSPASPASPALVGGFFTTAPGKPHCRGPLVKSRSRAGAMVLSLWGTLKVPTSCGAWCWDYCLVPHSCRLGKHCKYEHSTFTQLTGLKGIQLWRACVELFVCYFQQDVMLCLKKEMATFSSILAWRIPWTEEPGGLQSRGSWRVGHEGASEHTLGALTSGNLRRLPFHWSLTEVKSTYDFV